MESSTSWNLHIENTISKSLKRVGIIRNVKFKVRKNKLETMYNAYIIPILEYADTVWDGILDYLVMRLEKVQIEAHLIITGLTVSCPTAKLYKESGYSPLQTRRNFHRLIMLYNIISGEAPSYLTQLVPPRVGENNIYNLRNQDDFTQIFCRTE
jgi:hypothetical protein